MKQLFFHADLLSMQQGNSKEDQADALLVEDGVITRIGDGESLKAYCRRLPDTILTDLAGACLMPAFIDSHSHIVQVANSLRFVSLAEAKNFDQLCEKMIAALKQRSYAPQEWLIGVGYDHNFLEENRHPDRHILDTISKEHPIMISHASGHMGVTNSKGLSVLAIDENSPNPDGGVIGRDEQGAPNGYLEETAFMQAGAKIPPADQGQMEKLMVQAQRIYAGYGITTAQEGLMKQTEFDLLQSAAHKGLLFMDVVGYADIKQSARLYTDHRELAGRYRHGFRLGGYKLFLDGSPQGRTAWLSKPYLGTPADYCGYPVYSDQQVREFVAFAAKERAQLLTHCNGDEAAAQLLRAFRGEDHGLRPVMIHAQTLRPDQLPELKKIGMIPSYFVAHTYHWGDVHLANLGYERASRISPLASTLRAGIPFTLHQDSPVLPPDMLETVWCAVNRVTKAGKKLAQSESISAEQALRAVTANAAYAYFEEEQKGTLQAGKQADLVVLSQNPVKCPPARLKDIRVLATYKRGRRINTTD